MANQAVYGIVGSRSQAERIVQALVDVGIPHANISFLSQQGKEFPEFGTNGRIGTTGTTRNWRTEDRLTDYPTSTTSEDEFRSTSTTNGRTPKSTKTTDVSPTKNSKTNTPGGLGHEKHTKAPEGAATGATTGGIIGGTLGLLAGIGALAIPGLGPFIAAGPILATLSGIGAGGTLGGIIGALIGAGIPEYEAKRYENKLKSGGVLIAVRATSDEVAKRVKDILQKNGAEDVTISSEASVTKNYKKS